MVRPFCTGEFFDMLTSVKCLVFSDEEKIVNGK